jgi:ATP-dependent exoDNAse (exonuclease V) beta subunit
MANSNKDGKFSNWFDVKDHEGLASVNVSGFGKELLPYDEALAEFNDDNTYQNKIDRFCLQYVATTRAAEHLFLYIERPNKTANHLEIYDFLENKIPRNELDEEVLSFDLYPVSEEDLKKKDSAESEKFKTKAIAFKHENRPDPNAIKIATPSKSYQNRVEKVRTGIFTHEILAKINSADDLEKTLEKYLLDGIITEKEKSEITDRIFSIIKDEKYARYFAPGQKIINEKDIMISADGESSIYRPDRLIDTGSGFIIIDFKTGDVKEKHQVQVHEYRSVLEKLGYNVVETVIIYV